MMVNGPLTLGHNVSNRSRSGASAFGRSKRPVMNLSQSVDSPCKRLEQEDVKRIASSIRFRSDIDARSCMSMSDIDSGSDAGGSDMESSPAIDQRLLACAPPASRMPSDRRRASFIEGPDLSNGSLPGLDQFVECHPLEATPQPSHQQEDFLQPMVPQYDTSVPCDAPVLAPLGSSSSMLIAPNLAPTGPLTTPRLAGADSAPAAPAARCVSTGNLQMPAASMSNSNSPPTSFVPDFQQGQPPYFMSAHTTPLQQPLVHHAMPQGSSGYLVQASPAVSVQSLASGPMPGYQQVQFTPPPLVLGNSGSFVPAGSYGEPMQQWALVDPATMQPVMMPMQLHPTQSNCSGSAPILHAVSSGNLVPMQTIPPAAQMLPAQAVLAQPPQSLTPPPCDSASDVTSVSGQSNESLPRRNVEIGRFGGVYGQVVAYNVVEVVSPTRHNVVASAVGYYNDHGEYVFTTYNPRTVDKEDIKEQGLFNVRLQVSDGGEEHVVAFAHEEERKACQTRLERRYNLATMEVVGLVSNGINPKYLNYPLNKDFEPRFACKPFNKTLRSFELAILDVHKSLKIKDVKRTFNEIARTKHVQMPMNKQCEEWEKFQEYKQAGGASSGVRAPARVPNTSTVFLTLKDYESALRVLTICNAPEFQQEFGGIRVEWSHHSGAMRPAKPAVNKKPAKKQPRALTMSAYMPSMY